MDISIFNEVYQEEDGGTFSSDGKIYDINMIFKLSENLPILYSSISNLDWLLKYDNVDISNRNDIDINIPIIVSYTEDNLLLVVDGMHRLKKSIEENKEFIKVKFLDKWMLDKALLVK